MSQVLKSLQLVTQSYSGTPSTGTGALYASESKLYFENATGTSSFIGGPGYLVVREYTGSNPGGGTLTYTWNKPDNIKYIQVICVGAGGGGGSGANGNTSARRQGGSGGGGGATVWGLFDRQNLAQSSYTISVGAGGAGGQPVSNFSAGNTGTAGQYTTFGSTLVSASGGGGGLGGSSNISRAGGVGGLATSCLPGPGFAIFGGSGGGTVNNGFANTTLNFFATPITPISTAGGGAGGGYDNLTGPTQYSGSSGSSGFQWNTLQTNGGSPGKPATAASDNLVTAAVLLQFTSSIFSTTYGLGGGGHGGDVTMGGSGYAGSDGGKFGAGGGGGGASTSSTVASGAGGSGSSGLCIVVEYY